MSEYGLLVMSIWRDLFDYVANPDWTYDIVKRQNGEVMAEGLTYDEVQLWLTPSLVPVCLN